MPINNPLAAIVRVSKGEALGVTMSRLRTWLDGEKIQTTTFTTKVDARGFTLAIGFLSTKDADRFRRQFSDPPADSGASSRPPPEVGGDYAAT